ncbi:sperm equatorial segment protein 1 [Acomys russatus]|uniref:sperm equatorial segment protein 1 n=1 Tax=Acomys russatus TaxID=60746 RepID=UPI0021E23F3C|nr:sperm equatorial segment protein 1 [Acomys russatus]
MKPVVLVVLCLWPSSLLAYPTVTVLPDEEQNLNHYVQVLQKLIMSVPTRGGSGKKLKPSTIVDVAEPTLVHTPGEITAGEITSETDVLIRPNYEEKTAFPTSGFTLGIERRKKTKSTAFWSIRPNNISVVLHSDEPYIEKEEPEPEPEEPEELEPEPEAQQEPEPESEPLQEPEPEEELRARQTTVPTETSKMSSTATQPLASTRFTVTTRTSSNIDISTDSEDVPQLSGQSETQYVEDPSGRPSLSSRHEDILRKLSNINAQIQQGPLGDGNNPEYKEYIKASRDHLKRSLALAFAAEHKLQQMYRSRSFPEGRTSDSVDDMETVINMLYNARSKLPEYFNIKRVPLELREKVTAVTGVLKKLLCVGQVETQHLIRKLLSNNMKILNILDVP